MITLADKEACCGCSACSNICNHSAISMQFDEDGFIYPNIDSSKCINCGLCNLVCPISKDNGRDGLIEQHLVYAVKANDECVRRNSSSGGIFSVLAEYCLAQNGVVYGVSLDKEFSRAKHIKIDSSKDIARLRGSKYLQSVIGDSYVDVKKNLEEGKMVLFSGTPCQVNGLYKYLEQFRIKYDNLITVDVLCHGVPSNLVWEKYLNYLYGRHRKTINNINFRAKNEMWPANYSKHDYIRGTVYYPKDEDLFLRVYLSDYALRSSCYRCFVKETGKYLSDITIGDYWSIDRVDKAFNDGKGISIVIPHTNRGIDLLSLVNPEITIKQEEYISSIQGNSLLEQTLMPNERDLFFLDLHRKSLKYVCKKYAPLSLKTRLKIVLKKSNCFKNITGTLGQYGMEIKFDHRL